MARMASKDGGSFDAAPPPLGGLGNFKGVMLCNRPADDSSSGYNNEGPTAFKSMISTSHREKLGLTPCRNFEPTVKTRGPSAALRRHVRWLRELEGQMKSEREQVEEEDRQDEARERKKKEVNHGHREGVREMYRERQDVMEAEEAGKLAVRRAQRATEKAEKEARKAAATGKDSSQDLAPSKKTEKPSKPLWAMTEQEKDDFEEDEADELINFAENLDFDKFVGDLEFRQRLEAMKDRTNKLKKEQDAFKDSLVAEFNAMAEEEERSTSAGGSPRSKLEEGIDGQSLFGDLRSEYSACSGRSRGQGKARGEGEWDSSTQCDEDGRKIDHDVKQAAEAMMEMNPQLKAIHSKGSVQRIIERARERVAQEPPAANLMELMRREGPAPIPVITASADTQNKLHRPTDASMLPYLYRSPAV